MIACGLATYLHPVSGPPVAFALWAAMASCQEEELVPVSVRIRNAIVAGAAYAVMVLPFSFTFRTTTGFGDVTFDALDVALRNIYPAYLNLVRSLLKQLANVHLLLVFSFGAISLAIAWRRGERRVVGMLAIFSGALVLTSVIVPIADHKIAAAAGRVPFEMTWCVPRNI